MISILFCKIEVERKLAFRVVTSPLVISIEATIHFIKMFIELDVHSAQLKLTNFCLSIFCSSSTSLIHKSIEVLDLYFILQWVLLLVNTKSYHFNWLIQNFVRMEHCVEREMIWKTSKPKSILRVDCIQN